MLAPVHELRPLSQETHSDAELVLRACDGDQWAREAIFRRHVQGVFRMVRRLHRGDDVEDIVQDTFADGLEDLESLREPAALRSWLMGIALRRVQRAHRKKSLFRRFFVQVEEGLLEQEASRSCSPEQRAELALVDNALARASEAEKTAWVLRRIEGEKLTAIAEITRASLATVKRRIAAADARVESRRRT